MTDLIAQAWHTARFTRLKRLPSLKSILAADAPDDRTPEEIRAEFDSIVAEAGM